jgi:drug/metabolite transporter (DMT)-like permease
LPALRPACRVFGRQRPREKRLITTWHIVLLLVSGFLHTVWNGALKAGRKQICFVWWMILTALAIYAPFFGYQCVRYGLPREGLVIVALSGTCLGLYFTALAGAYAAADLSLAYPVSRGASPLFVLVLAVPVLGERVSIGGLAGILVVVAGLFMTNLRPGVNVGRAGRDRGILLALLTALFISFYRIVDKVGVGVVQPTVYYYASLLVVFAWVSLVVLRCRLVPDLALEWRANRWKILWAGALIYLSYAIVLHVMTAARISYVGAAANFGILFSVLWGVLVLKERAPATRIAGAALIVTGVTLIRLWG